MLYIAVADIGHGERMGVAGLTAGDVDSEQALVGVVAETTGDGAVEGDGTDGVADEVERNGIAWFGKHKLNVSYTTHLFLDSGTKVDSKIVVQNIDGIGRRQLRKSPV